MTRDTNLSEYRAVNTLKHETKESSKHSKLDHQLKLQAEAQNESQRQSERTKKEAASNHSANITASKKETLITHQVPLVFSTKKLYEQKQKTPSEIKVSTKAVSEQLIDVTAKKLREDLRADKWIIDPRGGDSQKTEQTLSVLPHDRETMQKLQLAYAADKAHPQENLSRDIQARLPKDDAERIKATVENPESRLVHLETAQKKIETNEKQIAANEKFKPISDSASVFLPAMGLVSQYNQFKEAETEKHLNAGRRELREQLSVMNSKDVNAADQESLKKNGKSLEQHLLETSGLRESDKNVVKILLKGSDVREKNPTLDAQLAAEAVKTKDIDLLRESLGNSKAREIFNKRRNGDLLSDSFSGNDLKTAQDLAQSGRLELASQVKFNRGLFGTSKEDVTQAIRTMSEEERTSLKRGHYLARLENCPANSSEQDKQALSSYLKFRQSLKESFNQRQAGDLQAQAIYGENNLISKLAQTHSDGILGIGAGHDRGKLYDTVDDQLSQDDYTRIKTNSAFRQELNANLNTYLSREEFERVNRILDRKANAATYEQSKRTGRSTLEKLQDLTESNNDGAKKGAVIANILAMSASERSNYRNDSAYRREIESQVQKSIGNDEVSGKIAHRLLQSCLQPGEKELKLNALEKVQVGGLLGARLTETIDNIETFINSDPTMLSRLKTPTNPNDKAVKETLDRELRQAIYRSGEVRTDESGQDNFEDIYAPLSKKLFEQKGKVDIAEKLTHIDHTVDAYKSLTAISAEERSSLLRTRPETEDDKTLQANVFGRFSSPQEKQLAQEVIASGSFSPLNQLRAAAISNQSLNVNDVNNIKETLSKLNPAKRAALNEEYSYKYHENLSGLLTSSR